MSTYRLISFTFALALSVAAVAQERPAAASPPVAAPSTPSDCAKPIARHDHGAEKGTPSPKAAMPCAATPAASATKTKAISGHDHAKFHKQM